MNKHTASSRYPFLVDLLLFPRQFASAIDESEGVVASDSGWRAFEGAILSEQTGLLTLDQKNVYIDGESRYSKFE